ncbi:MAG: hypothetical protein ACXVBK_16720 [Flavisolibacter sp.]
MKIAQKIDIRLLIIFWPIVQWVIWISFIVVLVDSEMNLSSNRWWNLAIHLFNIFKWPTLFFYGKDSWFPLFLALIGLAINSLIYALFLERLVTVFRLLARKNREPGQK